MIKNPRLPQKKCLITGLLIRQHEEWSNVIFSQSFSCEYKILGDKTIVIKGRGYADLEAETLAIAFGDEIVKTYMGSEYLMIQDWGEYKNSSGKARNAFIQSIVTDSALNGIIFCNGTPSQEISVLLGQKLGILNKEIRICKTYNEAAMIGLRFEQLGKIPKVRVSLFSGLINRFRYRNRESYNKPIRDLLEYLNSIDWTSGKPKSSGYNINDDHPLLPIFDALTLIKTQLDKTTTERNLYMTKLIEHQEELEVELKLRTEKIRRGEERFSRILKYSPISIVLIDKQLRITYINRIAEETFGYKLEELIENDNLHSLRKKIENSGIFILKDKLEELLPPPEEPGSFGPVEVELIGRNRSKHITELTFTATLNGYLVSIVDITTRKKVEEKLYAQSVTDSMTGFYNRRYFEDFIEKEFSRSRRNNHALTLITFDVDFFKKTNDEYGHPAGDSVLCYLADLARRYFRSHDLLFRIGGEEFAVLLPETDGELGLIAAERYRSAVNNSNHEYNNQVITMSISLGVATMTEDITCVEDLVKKADEALYRAKGRGRNCTEVYNK
ncbi:MAG: diguanylate cyclase [Spirochaetaceae bacterium]